ncbi:MAG: MFS transporter [Richelia sp. CSU_2_1]|nr:MFS transporter [Richelia sp. CSU_2_1]
MIEQVGDFKETLSLQTPDILEQTISQLVPPPKTDPKISKQRIRSTLRASTLDGVFATIFSCTTGGVLLSNFFLELGATSWEIGILSAIPMLVNLLQPLGAYLADRTNSRHWYNLWIFGVSRLLWLVLVAAIAAASWRNTDEHGLLEWTLAIVFITSLLGSLASANWFSWMTAVVPHRLRGRYFGLRNSATTLITLLGVPLMGAGAGAWSADPVVGYGVILFFGVVAGMLSLGFQFLMVDVNPQARPPQVGGGQVQQKTAENNRNFVPSVLKDVNFLKFLAYFTLWTFAVNLSAPFFNIYLLKDLNLDVSLVTIYSSLSAGANLLLLMFWGKLADRLGNRPLLIAVGLLVAVTPVLWLGIGDRPIALWLWLPLLHLLAGTTLGAIDLCTNNIQMEIAPIEHPSTYFAIASAISGVAGACGTTTGGFLAEIPGMNLGGLFAISTAVRLLALLPLLFLREPRSLRLRSIVPAFLFFNFNWESRKH